MVEMFIDFLSFVGGLSTFELEAKQKREEESSHGEPLEVNKCKLYCPIISNTNHIEGRTLEQKVGQIVNEQIGKLKVEIYLNES